MGNQRCGDRLHCPFALIKSSLRGTIPRFMQSRQAFLLLVTLLLIFTLLAGLSQVLPRKQATLPVAQLENVRDYVSALVPGGADYAIAAGKLFIGHPGYWVEAPLPEDVIAGAVDVRM